MYAITGASLRRSTDAGIRWTSPLVDGATLKARALAVSARQLFVIDNEQRLLRNRPRCPLAVFLRTTNGRVCFVGVVPQASRKSKVCRTRVQRYGANGPIFYGVTGSGGVFRLSPTPASASCRRTPR